MLAHVLYTDHHSGRWERVLLGGGHMSSKQTAVTPPKPSSAPERQRGLSWRGKEVTIDQALGGTLFPHAEGMVWTPSQGYRLEPLEKQTDRAFYALISPDGECTIVIMNSIGVRNARVGEIPSMVLAKSLTFSGGEFHGEAILPVRTHDGLIPVASAVKPGNNDLEKKHAEYFRQCEG